MGRQRSAPGSPAPSRSVNRSHARRATPRAPFPSAILPDSSTSVADPRAGITPPDLQSISPESGEWMHEGQILPGERRMSTTLEPSARRKNASRFSTCPQKPRRRPLCRGMGKDSQGHPGKNPQRVYRQALRRQRLPFDHAPSPAIRRSATSLPALDMECSSVPSKRKTAPGSSTPPR